MPCFSASNVRFISAQQQQEASNFSYGRSKTASRSTFGQVDQHVFPRVSESTRRHCTQVLRAKGMDFFVPSSNTKAKIKLQFRHAVKSKPTTLSYKELERLHNAAKVITVEERLDALAKQEQMVKQLDEQAERLRTHFRKIDDQRSAAAEKSTIKEDLFGIAEKQKTLERAFIAKQEQEEEVKAVNRIILNAKCHAVRDAQVQEKHDIERDQKQEEMRLEKLAIEEAVKALAQDDCWAEKQKERNAKYAREIREQLLQRENLRFLEAERAEEEARVQREAAAELKRDEERHARKAWDRRQQFRNELKRVIEMSNIFKRMLYEQEREADMRVAAYMREKREREQELKREQQLAKEEHERQQQRLYQLAQKIADSKSHHDEMSYIREQERVERDYRRREKEAVLRKRQLEREIQEARERQMLEIKSRQALQIAREEKDFNILIDNLKKEEVRLKREEEERRKQQQCYRSDIMKQMSEKAVARRRMVENERSEANLWREAERQRLDNIRAVISAKLTAMRNACLPERYIKDVERQLNRVIKTNSQPQQQEDT